MLEEKFLLNTEGKKKEGKKKRKEKKSEQVASFFLEHFHLPTSFCTKPSQVQYKSMPGFQELLSGRRTVRAPLLLQWESRNQVAAPRSVSARQQLPCLQGLLGT